MDAIDAIRNRRSVRRYTDKPVSDGDIEELCRLGLLAPTDSMSQAWSIIVVRDSQKCAAVADLMIRGGARYFEMMRPPAEGQSAEEHAQACLDYANTVMETYPKVPVWIVGLRVPRKSPGDGTSYEPVIRDANMVSVGFMFENIMVAARAKGLGTVASVFHLRVEDEFRALLEIPDEVEAPLITPLGYPEEFPTSLPPALKKIKRHWTTLVHDDAWGNPRG
ncbi:MAG: nitroreductase family protein [Miltoncostaeaceae bacterium]